MDICTIHPHGPQKTIAPLMSLHLNVNTFPKFHIFGMMIVALSMKMLLNVAFLLEEPHGMYFKIILPYPNK